MLTTLHLTRLIQNQYWVYGKFKKEKTPVKKMDEMEYKKCLKLLKIKS